MPLCLLISGSKVQSLQCPPPDPLQDAEFRKETRFSWRGLSFPPFGRNPHNTPLYPVKGATKGATSINTGRHGLASPEFPPRARPTEPRTRHASTGATRQAHPGGFSTLPIAPENPEYGGRSRPVEVKWPTKTLAAKPELGPSAPRNGALFGSMAGQSQIGDRDLPKAWEQSNWPPRGRHDLRGSWSGGAATPRKFPSHGSIYSGEAALTPQSVRAGGSRPSRLSSFDLPLAARKDVQRRSASIVIARSVLRGNPTNRLGRPKMVEPVSSPAQGNPFMPGLVGVPAGGYPGHHSWRALGREKLAVAIVLAAKTPNQPPLTSYKENPNGRSSFRPPAEEPKMGTSRAQRLSCPQSRGLQAQEAEGEGYSRNAEARAGLALAVTPKLPGEAMR